MAWKTLAEALESALASNLEKGAGTEAPASACQGDTALLVQEDDASRRMTVATASPKAGGYPSPAAVIRLVVIEGGRPARGGGSSRAAYRASGEEGEPARNLKLVSGHMAPG